MSENYITDQYRNTKIKILKAYYSGVGVIHNIQIQPLEYFDLCKQFLYKDLSSFYPHSHMDKDLQVDNLRKLK